MGTPNDRGTVVTLVASMTPEPTAPMGPACLVVIYGTNLGKRFFLETGETIIGRSDLVQIQVEQESISRQHAKVISDGTRQRLVDLNSTNGTFVNDQTITDAILSDGDFVRVGQTIFKYLAGTNIESKYHEEIYRLTTVDGLTHAYNKRYFLESLERELNRAQRYSRALSLIMLDIDHFKNINDTYSHLAGDYVLREMGSQIIQNLRREDIFSRYGGEEFAILLPEIGLEDARQVAEKLRRKIESQTFMFSQKTIPVTASFGVHATKPNEPDVTSEQFIAAADAKLYEAKQSGRNRVCCST